MPTLAEIRGQPRAVAVLRRAIAQGRVAHAYLFCGPAGTGKHTCGLALAAALNCLEQPGEGCGRCLACEKIAAGIHPDVRTLAREGAAQIIPIETIRGELIPSLGMPPHEGRARVILIEEAAALQGASANALLKTLEEPPARTHFVLGTTAPDQLLPTIRSRCQRIGFAALPPDLRAELSESGEGAVRLGELADRIERAVADGSARAIGNAAVEVAQERTEVSPALQLYAMRLHQQARAAASRGELGRAAAIGRRAQLVLEIDFAVTEHNAHGQIALDDLLRRVHAVPVPQ